MSFISNLFGGGGGGGSQQAAPQQTTSNVYQTNIPDYAQPYVSNMLNATQSQLFNTDSSGNITGFNQYQPYTGMTNDQLTAAQSAVAGFSPLQQQAQSSAANLQVPGQYGAATGQTMRGIMGANQIGGQMQNLAASANPYDFQKQVGGYMNPYIQQSLAPQLQLANQQYGIAGTQMAGQATGAGAFGGSRNALQQGLNQQNQMLAQNQLISQGYNTAFSAAQNQYNQSGAFQLQGLQGALGAQQQGMAGAAQLGSLGQAQLAAQQGILGTQNQLGAQQQANQQQVINQGIQNYATAQQYPLMQLGTMSNMLRGLPLQSSTTQSYQAAPSALTQAVGAAGTGAMLGSMYAKEGGLLKTKKMAAGGIASYGAGDIVESTESDLEQMPSNALNKELASTTSDLVKSKIRGILQARAGAQYAGGGIIAFDEGTKGNSVGDDAAAAAADDGTADNAYLDRSRGLVEGVKNIGRAFTTPSNYDPIQKLVLDPAKAIQNWGQTPLDKQAAEFRSASQTPNQTPVLGGQTMLPSSASQTPNQTPVLGGLTPNESVVQPNAAPAPVAAAPAGVKAAPSPEQTVTAVQKQATNQTIARATDPTSTSWMDLLLPKDKSETIKQYLAEKEKYVGPDTSEANKASLEARKEREQKSYDQMDKLVKAQMFAKMGTTPGSLLTAALTGFQAGVPALVSNIQKRDEIINQIDDSIMNIDKAKRLERAGNFDESYKFADKGIDQSIQAHKALWEHMDKQAEVSAKFAQTGLDKSILQYQKAQGQYQTEVEKIATEKQKDTQYGMDKRMQEMYATRLKQNPNDTEAKTKYDEISRRVAPKETDWNNRVNEIREYRDRFDTGRVPPKQGITQAAPQQNMPLYASNGKDRIVSNDGGRTWQPVGAK